MRSKLNNHSTWKIQIQLALDVLLDLTQREKESKFLDQTLNEITGGYGKVK